MHVMLAERKREGRKRKERRSKRVERKAEGREREEVGGRGADSNWTLHLDLTPAVEEC